MQPRFHLLAAVASAWMVGLLFIVGAALLHGSMITELPMLALVILGFTCATVLIAGLLGLAIVRVLESLHLLRLHHFIIASILAAAVLGALGAVFFLVCVSEPSPRSFGGEFAFTFPLALVMSVAGFVSYWMLSHYATANA